MASETDEAQQNVVYTSLPPAGGAVGLIVGILAGVFMLAVLVGVVARQPDWRDIGGVGLFFALPTALFLFFSKGARQGPLIRRFAPYHGLARPARDDEHLMNHVVYRHDDHVGAVVFNTKLPVVGSLVLYSNADAIFFKTLRDNLASEGLAVPRTIADERLKPKVSAIPLERDLLEPEFIIGGEGGGASGAIAYGVVVVWLLMASLSLMWGNKAVAGIYMLVALGSTTRTPFLRRYLRAASWERDAPIAGCGVLKAHDKRRWTCEDGVMFLRSNLSGGVSAIFLGMAGVFVMSFPNVTDPDFINLWQRWNHLDPKPGLLE